MTTPPTLPTLPGLTWSKHKKPGFSTRVASHVSGREVRVAFQAYPLYEFEAKYDGLTDSASGSGPLAGLQPSSLQTLMGFFLQMQGQFGVFLYADPSDGTATGQAIATGDGSTKIFQMVRTLGGFVEPVGWVTSLSAVYLNGVVQGSGTYGVAGNQLTFVTAPASGKLITANFSYAFQCRFLDDQMDFENFMLSLWSLGSMKFRSVKATFP